MLKNLFRDSGMGALLGLWSLTAALLIGGLTLLALSPGLFRILGGVLLVLSLVLIVPAVTVTKQLVGEHADGVGRKKVILRSPIVFRMPLARQEQTEPLTTEHPRERVVVQAPPYYAFLSEVLEANRKGVTGMIQPRDGEDENLGLSLRLDDLQPYLTIGGPFRNESIFPMTIESADGYVRIKDVGDLQPVTAAVGYRIRPQRIFRLNLRVDLPHEATRLKLKELLTGGNNILWDLRHVEVWLRPEGIDGLPPVKVPMPQHEVRLTS